MAATPVDEHVLDRPSVDERLAWNDDHLLARERDRDRAVHPRPQLELLVRELEPNLRRARRGVDRRIHELHRALERSVGKSSDGELRRLTDLHARELVLVHVGDDPHLGEVGDGEEIVAGLEVHPLHRALRDDPTADGRVYTDRLARLAAPLDRVDLATGDAEQLEAHARVVSQRRSAAVADGSEAARGQVLHLREIDLRRVHGREQLTALHLAARLGDDEPLDPTGVASGDLR